MDVKFDPLKCCPMCGKRDLDSDLHDIDTDTIYWYMVCNDCGFRWIDVFEYTRSVTDDDNEEELVIVKGE